MSAFCIHCGDKLGANRVMMLEARHLMAMLSPPEFAHRDCAEIAFFAGVRFAVSVRINSRKEPSGMMRLGRMWFESIRPVKYDDTGCWVVPDEAEWTSVLDAALDEGLRAVHDSTEQQPESASEIEQSLHDRHARWKELLRR